MSISKRRIAIIIPGGIGTGPNNMGVPVLERQVKLLAKDFDIVVFSLFKVNAGYKPDGFEIVSIASRNPIIKSLAFLFAFRKHNARAKFSVIHGFWAFPPGFLAVLVGRIYSIKSVVSILGGDGISLPEIKYGQLRNIFTRKLIIWTLHHATNPIALTKYLEDNLKKYGLKRDLQIIPWGIDTELFKYNEKKIETPIQLLHIANLHPVKDQPTLIKAFKLIRDKIDSHLTIIGTGEYEMQMKEMIHSLELQNHVTLVKPMSYELLPAYYNKAHLLLHTSLSEGQCEVVTEAMSAGVVVCGTSVGILYDKPDCCVSVDVKDYKGLAEKVLNLINNKSQIESLKVNASKFTKTCDFYWTIEQIKKIYQDS
jgi:glycosyltransferase involved in cell wall biosynthesis